MPCSTRFVARSSRCCRTRPSWPCCVRWLPTRTLEGAAVHCEPHRIAFYLHDLASAFHALWTRGKEEPSLRFLLLDDPETTRARLAVLTAVRQVIANGLGVMGVRPVEELH